jgi:hypothetical protein
MKLDNKKPLADEGFRLSFIECSILSGGPLGRRDLPRHTLQPAGWRVGVFGNLEEDGKVLLADLLAAQGDRQRKRIVLHVVLLSRSAGASIAFLSFNFGQISVHIDVS